MRRRAGTSVGAALSAVAVIVGLAGCSGDSSAVAETPAVRHLEARIAAFAASHEQVISAAGADRPGVCAVRLLGRSEQAHHTQKAYLELLCSSVSPGSQCPTASSSSGVGAAVATLAAGQRVTGISVDDENDEAYGKWIKKRFPANLRHLENHGPQYGDTLNRRVLTAHHC